jgi:hypothetical protein
MQVSKQTVVDLLRNDGNEGRAAQFDSEAPDTIDTERDTELLQRFGIRLDDVAAGPAGLGDRSASGQPRQE